VARPRAMHNGCVAWARNRNFSIGRSESPNLVARIPSGTILDVLRTDKAIDAWFAFLINLLGVGALNSHSYDLWRFLI
jgi:hypothetical protein